MQMFRNFVNTKTKLEMNTNSAALTINTDVLGEKRDREGCLEILA